MAVEKPRFLVVDDDENVLRLIEVILNRAGVVTIKAMNAAQAAQVLKAKPLPDLMVLDLMLPDVSGIEFLRQVRSKELFNDLPILILSALADPDQIREALAQGADRYLTKPYLANNLMPVTQEMLRTGRIKK